MYFDARKSQPMKHIKILLFLDEQDCMPNHVKSIFKFIKKLVDMGLDEDVFFEQFLFDCSY